MSRSNAWKVWERTFATDHGGTRTGPRGFGLPDSIDCPGIAPECKYMQQLSLRASHMDQARENATRIGKPPVLFLKQAGHKGRKVVVIEYDTWLEKFWPHLKEAFTSWPETST